MARTSGAASAEELPEQEVHRPIDHHRQQQHVQAKVDERMNELLRPSGAKDPVDVVVRAGQEPSRRKHDPSEYRLGEERALIIALPPQHPDEDWRQDEVKQR
jgi:hypothetical protein